MYAIKIRPQRQVNSATLIAKNNKNKYAESCKLSVVSYFAAVLCAANRAYLPK